jgi:hypothetical protein
VMPAYGREALQRFREEQTRRAVGPEKPPSLLDSIPLNAPIDQPEQVLHCWSEEHRKWMPWGAWLASRPLLHDDAPEPAHEAEPRPEFGNLKPRRKRK